MPVQRLGDIAGINEQLFPGSAAYDYAFYGWINDRRNTTFPSSLRHQGRATGHATLEGQSGNIEVSISSFPNKEAAAMIGEKFTAGWQPG
ncbi:MAG: hypothetical protein ACFB2W_00620 [Leptolyngbyaceae cyanobacterium]